ncbi:MAG TPA: type II secretion system protein [Bdellovibrionota bacterium]|jgi:type II secretory pathway pseudopilin PulG
MRLLREQNGFSLLEVMIAFAMIVVVLFAALITQTGGINSSTRNRNIIVATNLARNVINQQEVKYEGQSFERLPKTEDVECAEFNKDFKCSVAYEEVDFSALSALIGHASKDEQEKDGNTDSGASGQLEMVLKIFQEYMKKSVRRMTVTIEWPEGSGTTSQTFTELLVNYDAELTVAI